ncbi:expressed hypothetical protein [Trichoplax adhaerens]|uniref:Type-1 angiotensin II receptor-associated protein n=1 Tax=Trichoplax adhaerens TaxID=10228 RepID=B3S065_TRIAD|nr:expressed hypothetical protein [Trichoplax adhaerens]EDV23952.1 expressed hypothetical protein [Trichoplax adhaerens]|eukprot:XP_002113478.1 expressed hypothetical protein [Trichoplax adhaerens]
MSQNPPLSVSGDYPNQNYQQPPPIGAASGFPQHGDTYSEPNQQTWQQQQTQGLPFRIPVVPLKVLILIDFLLVVWGAEYPWLPASYLFGNFTVIALGIWSIIDEKNPDGPHMMLLTLTITILQDIIMVAVRYPVIAYKIGGTAEFRFSAGMAILNIILKPFYCFVIYGHLTARGGSLLASFQRKNYESIDSPQQQQAFGANPPPQDIAASASPYQDTYRPYSQPQVTPTLPEYPVDTKPPVA